MKMLFVFVAVIALVAGCGGAGEPVVEGESVSDDGGDSNGEVENPPVEEVVLYPEGTLDPSLVTADVPVSAGDLFTSFYAWDGQTVVLQGYPFVYYGDSTTIENEIKIVAAPGEQETLVEVSFAEPLNLTIPSGEPVTVSGTVEYSWTGRIELVDGEIVPDGPVAEEMELSPFAYDGTTPVPVDEFFDVFNVWIGKEVTVDGHYHSTTVSVLSSGDIVRVDLSDPVSGSKCVACEMAGEIPEATNDAMSDNRDNTQIRGTIVGESFDMVGLEGCVLVNR